MIFVINKLKYDTDKMQLISEKCEYTYKNKMFGSNFINYGKDVKLWRSVNDRWLLTYNKGYSTTYAEALTKEKAGALLLRYDIDKYEELFEKLEEA